MHAHWTLIIRFEPVGRGISERSTGFDFAKQEAQGYYTYRKWRSGTGHKIEVEGDDMVVSTEATKKPIFAEDVSTEHATIEKSTIIAQHHVALKPSTTNILKWEVEVIEDGTSARRRSSNGNTVQAFASDKGSSPNMFFFEQSKKAAKKCGRVCMMYARTPTHALSHGHARTHAASAHTCCQSHEEGAKKSLGPKP